MNQILSFLAAVLCLVVLELRSQSFTWRQAFPAHNPASRREHSMVYTAGWGGVIMFGGIGVNGDLGDTWQWSGGDWMELSLASHPSPRSGHAMAFDPTRGRIVLFGGLSGSVLLGDTWEFDGLAWSLVSAPGPSPRSGHAMMAVGGGVLLFGGSDGADLADTWIWNGSAWVAVALSTVPSARSDHAMSDGFMFGGSHGSDDVWQWNGASWSIWAHSISPSARSGHCLASRPMGGVWGAPGLWMYGGAGLADTWSYNASGLGWDQLSTASSPSPRQGAAMCRSDYLNPQGIQVAGALLFGGDSGGGETWVLGETPFVQQHVGMGCGGAMGGLYGPATSTGWSMYDPWLSSSAGQAQSFFQIGLLGLSDSALPVPLNLTSLLVATPLSGPCSLHIDPLWILDCGWSGFPGNWLVVLPGIPSAVRDLYAQGVMVGLGAYGSFYLSVTPAFKIL